MAIKTVEGKMNVLEASRQRIINIFNSGVDIHLSISGGKDSIVLASLVYQLIIDNKIDKSKLRVLFIDEEAIFDDVATTVMSWRQKFIMLGVPFDWFCLQIKGLNSMDKLQDNESFIIWDRYAEKDWVRKMPSFAIKSHPLCKDRKENYQAFSKRYSKGVITLIGVRVAESATRLQNMATIFGNTKNDGGISEGKAYPIYDWTDDDVWLHIQRNNLEFPKTYMDLWAIGVGRNGLRMSQFFSKDSAKNLVRIEEHQPGLMKRIVKRVPNAYIASLYWDTEVFGRDKKSTDDKDLYKPKSYKVEVLIMLSNIPHYFETPTEQAVAKKMKNMLLKYQLHMEEKHFKEMYQILKTGDVFNRSSRILSLTITSDYSKRLEAK